MALCCFEEKYFVSFNQKKLILKITKLIPLALIFCFVFYYFISVLGHCCRCMPSTNMPGFLCWCRGPEPTSWLLGSCFA